MLPEAVVSADIPRFWPSVVKYGLPGSFCAGVERSVNAYRDFIAARPDRKIYSVGEPAHNRFVNEEFRNRVTFVSSIDEVPDNEDVAFGPHGHTAEDVAQALLGRVESAQVSSVVQREPTRDVVFTECPLVTKVKNEIEQNTADGYITIYYGQLSKDQNGANKPHPETRAAMSAGNVRLVTSLEEALSDDLYEQITDPTKVAFATQTTHNADEALEMAESLLEIYPNMRLPKKEDICYATRDRQKAAKAVIEDGAEVVVVIGDKETSSNTRSLAAAAVKNGARVIIVNEKADLNPEDFYGAKSVGVVASASTPGIQVQGVIGFFEERGSRLEKIIVSDESNIHFKAPKEQHAYLPEIVWVRNPSTV